MFNISEFKARVNRHNGFAKTSLFEVRISPVSVNRTPIASNDISTNDLRFFCQTVTAPGINIETSSYKPNGVGFPEFMPVSATADSMNAVFLLDSNHKVLSFFHRWMSTIVNISGERGDTENGLGSYLIGYKDDYASSEVTILHYSSHNNNRYYESRYSGVYPTQVSAIDLNWGANDSVATITVNFSYNKIIQQGFQSGNFESSTNFIGSQDSITRGGNIPQINQNFIDTVTT